MVVHRKVGIILPFIWINSLRKEAVDRKTARWNIYIYCSYSLIPNRIGRSCHIVISLWFSPLYCKQPDCEFIILLNRNHCCVLVLKCVFLLVIDEHLFYWYFEAPVNCFNKETHFFHPESSYKSFVGMCYTSSWNH